MLCTEMDFSSKCIKALLWFPGSENAKQFPQRIEEAVDNPFLERDDGVVGDRNTFRTDLRATLCDIAQSDTELRSQILQSIDNVQWVHLQSRHMNEKSWTNE